MTKQERNTILETFYITWTDWQETFYNFMKSKDSYNSDEYNYLKSEVLIKNGEVSALSNLLKQLNIISDYKRCNYYVIHEHKLMTGTEYFEYIKENYMHKLAKRNKINVAGQFLFYFSIASRASNPVIVILTPEAKAAFEITTT